MEKHTFRPNHIFLFQLSIGFSILYFFVSYSSAFYSPTSIVNASEIQSIAVDVNVYIEESRIGTSFYINTRTHNYEGDYVPIPINDVTNN